jgi:hypothetical protein
MSNRNRYFNGQMEHEEVITFYRKHWVYLLPELLPLLLVAIVFLFALAILANFGFPKLNDPLLQGIYLVTVCIMLFFIHRSFLRIIKFFLSTVIITNFRLIETHLSLFLRNSKESIDMTKIQDVQKVQHGFFSNLLKFGQMQIILGNSEQRILYQVPNPDYHYRLINRIKSNQYFKKIRDREGKIILEKPIHNPLNETLPRVTTSDVEIRNMV